MSENIPDVQFLMIEVNRSDDSVLVSADIEDVKVANFVARIEHRLQISKA